MDFPRMCPARWLSDPNFGMRIPSHDFLYQFYDMHSNYYRPWKWFNRSISEEFGSTIENEKGNYKITLDVQHFRPNDINVKVTDKEIIVEGRHEERPDTHGFITRQFKRRYPLPSHYPPENVTSTLSSDGILTIIAEKILFKETEKIVPIKICGEFPKKTQMETKTTTEMSQKTQKGNLKDTENIMSKNNSQIMLKEDHSRLLKSEFLKDTTLESSTTCTSKTAIKESMETKKTAEKTDPLDIGRTSNKIEETIGKTILGLTALTEQLSQSSAASTSEACNKKSASEICNMKGASETCEMKGATEACGIKGATEACGMKGATEACGMNSATETCGMKGPTEVCGMKSATEACGMKSATEACGMKVSSEMSNMKATSETCTKSASEMCGMKGVSEASAMKSMTDICEIKGTSESSMKAMSKTLIEESMSSYKASSSSTSSTTQVSERVNESISDIISAELREAAENV